MEKYMEKYMETGCGKKIVEAEKEWKVTEEKCEPGIETETLQEGYRVRYQDGNETWIPKERFEAEYMPLM